MGDPSIFRINENLIAIDLHSIPQSCPNRGKELGGKLNLMMLTLCILIGNSE